MEALPCGHVARPGAALMCAHLFDPANTGLEYVRRLTGRGLDADFSCTACDGNPDARLLEVCEGCVARYAEEEWGDLVAWRGEPGIPERPEPVDPAVVVTPLPGEFGTVIDIAPTRSDWLLLTEAGSLVRFDARTGSAEHVATSSLPAESGHEPIAGQERRRRLHVATDGRFAAVVTDFGRHGQVIDLATGEVTLALHGGDHHPHTVPFSLAFAAGHERTVLIHRTAWNRLDVSDPATGELLTARDEADHYRGYFHGALHPSPSGHWLADDGWVWSPVGMPSVWDLRRWLDTNPWESEDGPTRRRLCQRWYHWTVPMCWIGDDLLAVSGIGTDDLAMLPGVRIFDVASGAELHTFAGPRGALFGAGRRLYSAGADGMEIWDPFTGHRTGRIPGFVPAHHHAGAAELVSVRDGALLRWAIGR